MALNPAFVASDQAASRLDPSGFNRGEGGWRTDTIPFDERPIYQFVLVEGYQEHSGKMWHRRWAGTACISRHGHRFGYRASDIDRIQQDGDMMVATGLIAWMPAAWPRWDFDEHDTSGDTQ